MISLALFNPERDGRLVLRVEQLQVGALPALNFEVADRECLAIEGASGAGKTLLLRAIADLDEVPGQVFVDGAERAEMPGEEWRRRVRYCAAEPQWWTEEARPAFPATALARIQRLMQTLELDEALLDRPISVLSTGERQRLALVRALVDEPRVLLLDEPTSALPPQAAALVEELIKFNLLSGRSVVLVSHDQAQIERLSHARLLLTKSDPATTTAVSP